MALLLLVQVRLPTGGWGLLATLSLASQGGWGSWACGGKQRPRSKPTCLLISQWPPLSICG